MKLSEKQVRKILESPTTKIPETNLLFDISLPERERIQNAKEILNARKEESR